MKDRFSDHSQEYAAFRPTYPQELYDFIFSHVKHFDQAWDAGTGNGQAARDLAKRFVHVAATDISPRQLENAPAAKEITYSLAGEVTTLQDKSVDLVTVAQAIHWFDRDKFYEEVERVAKPDALVAIWGYGLLRIHTDIDSRMDHFYTTVVGPYWDKERRLIDEHYKTISFPFKEIPVPTFDFSFAWTLEQFKGYLETWSAVRKYTKSVGFTPVGELLKEIKPIWGTLRTVRFPLFMRAGRVELPSRRKFQL